MDSSLLLQLRSATAAQHEHAETYVGTPQTLDGHIQTLKAFYGFIDPWETKAAAKLATLESELCGRWKASILSEDLKFLGLSASDIASLPRCEHLPSMNDIPSALGSMYVFEGSTLGGQILSKHIEKQLGLRDSLGYAYYQSYGDKVGVMWREFREVLVTKISSEDHWIAVRSAQDTFQRLGDWFKLRRRESEIDVEAGLSKAVDHPIAS